MRTCAKCGGALCRTAVERARCERRAGAQQLGLGVSCSEEVVSAPTHVYGLTNNLEARLGAGALQPAAAVQGAVGAATFLTEIRANGDLSLSYCVWR